VYEVSLLDKVDFGATGLKAKLQNVRFILSTVLQSCPMDRGFGWAVELDAPTEYARTNLAAQIIEAIELSEPGVSVLEVSFKEGTEDVLDGKMIPVVKVEIDDGEI
jgi:uncharacterized protein